jgi:uncharacterized Rossmann fold enzyme
MPPSLVDLVNLNVTPDVIVTDVDLTADQN